MCIMKRLFNYVLTGTLCLATMACQQEQLDPNGVTNDPDVQEVSTQFILNVSAAPTTKMSADAVQQDDNFRGIEHAVLFTYKTGLSGKPHVLSTTAEADKSFDFGSLISEGGLDPDRNLDGSTGTTPGSKRILTLSIPVNTDAVLFYGKAPKPATGHIANDNYGATTTVNLGTKAEDTKFAAVKILDGTETVNSYDATARLMIWIINNIKDRSLSADATSYAAKGWTLDAVTWAQYGHRYEYDNYSSTCRYSVDKCLPHPVEGLEEVLGKCYYLFTYILPAGDGRPHGEYRGGSSFAVQSMIIDMYKVITAAIEAEPTTANEANAKRMAQAILNRAETFFNTTNGNYKAITDIKSQLIDVEHLYTESMWNTTFGGAKDLNGYPYEDFGIPEGAAQLGFVPEGGTFPSASGKSGTADVDEFFYNHPNNPLVNYTMPNFEPRKYVFPAELYYYVNSPLRTTGNDVTYASYPDGVNNWNADASWTGWDDFPGKVSSSTRGVAVAHSINYGVALLKSSVKIASGVTYFLDNRYTLSNHAEANKEIPVSSAQLSLRGILIGGVNPRMNWQFTRFYTSGNSHEGLGDLSKFDGVIYDHILPSSTIPTPAASPNYTLVYDNYNSSNGGGQAQQNDVYVALEFVNNGEAFYGRDNLIHSGATFYLVAKLDKPTADQASALSWPADHHIAPLYGVNEEEVPAGKEAGQSKQIARIFIQDFMTTVNFSLNATSLQHAYYSTPDLRASQMSLGLDVDLQWTPGLVFNDIPL